MEMASDSVEMKFGCNECRADNWWPLSRVSRKEGGGIGWKERTMLGSREGIDGEGESYPLKLYHFCG